MQKYQFEKIYSQMEKEFGKIRSGSESEHSIMLFPLESNLLKTHRKYPSSNSRRLREAIALALFDAKARYTNTDIPLDNFRNEDNAKLEHALLMAFDPFTNEDIHTALVEQLDMDITDLTVLHEYYREAIICMLRIKESVDTWEKRMGANGYFDFVENTIGSQITGEDMNFTVVGPEISKA